MDDLNNNSIAPAVHRRRARYSGKNPRRFDEKYKELDALKHPEIIAKVIASGKTPAGTHRPILVAEILEALTPKPGEVAVDATLGYGGHASEILPRIAPGGKLIGIDTDPLQLPRTEERLRALGFGVEIFVAAHSNYAGLPKVLAVQGLEGADLVLADLGVSSMQLDDPARGFSYKGEGPLDLRMNPRKGQPAAQVIGQAREEEIARWLSDYADEPFAREIARAIALERVKLPILKTGDLRRTVETTVKVRARNLTPKEVSASVRRVFQAVRIQVNDEFSALETFLRFLPSCLKPGGRVAILTFHSGEDRRVKQAFAEGKRTGIYGRISNEVIRASEEEVRDNSRASSAKLRWAIRA